MAKLLDTVDPVLGLPALIALILGLFFLMLTVIHFRKRRIFRSISRGVVAMALLGGSIIFLLLGINLHTYQRLTYERPVAELSFQKAGPQQYRVSVTTPADKAGRSYRLKGDEWQIDARVLKWKAPANLLGLNARYRLERLSGRYRDVGQQRERSQTVYGLTPEEGLNLWQAVSGLRKYIGWVDTYYGSATYLPMADNARFEVILTQSGLVARPLNEEAEQAVAGW